MSNPGDLLLRLNITSQVLQKSFTGTPFLPFLRLTQLSLQLDTTSGVSESVEVPLELNRT